MPKIPFGLADITIGDGGESPIVFDGVSYYQVEGGEVSLTPILEEVNLADYGGAVWDEILTGYEGEVTIAANDSRDLELLAVALSGVDTVTDTETGKVTHIMDAKIGTSLRDRAKTVRIHPRDMGTDQSLDIVIHKMGVASEFTQTYENSQGQMEITLKMYPKDGADPNQPNNFFYIGATNPTAPTEPIV
jgi:hypothetical protein